MANGLALLRRAVRTDQHPVSSRLAYVLTTSSPRCSARTFRSEGLPSKWCGCSAAPALRKIETDDRRDVGVQLFVVRDAGANGVGQRNVPGTMRVKQPGHSQRRAGRNASGFEEVVVHAAIDHIHAAEPRRGPHVDDVVVHEEVPAFDERHTHFPCEKRVLEIRRVSNAGSQHDERRLHPFRDAGEGPYRTFLGVPVVDRGALQGVLVVQTAEARSFSDDDVRMLVMAGAQLAPIVEEARATEQFVVPAHQRLGELAQNLWWSWDDESTSLFRELNPLLWGELDHNPVALLQLTEMHALDDRASQLALHGRINYAYRRLQEYLTSKRTWGARHASVLGARLVAYFSAEFGLHESIPIYSGGLGVLAGDHLKSASDLGIPLVGVGLYYDQGYFRQRLISTAGSTRLHHVDIGSCRCSLVARGAPLVIRSYAIGTDCGACLNWRGPNTLALSRFEYPGNRPEDRDSRRGCTEGRASIAGSPARDRRRQAPMHLASSTCRSPHEYHSAFAALELVRRRMETRLSRYEAMDACLADCLHHAYPLPAGHDCYRFALVEEHLGRSRRRSPALHVMAPPLNPSDSSEHSVCGTGLSGPRATRSRRSRQVSPRAMWAPLFSRRRVNTSDRAHTNGST